MRIAFKMSVSPGMEEEYASRHQPIWDELASVLIEHGVQTYTIFLDQETGDLFAYAEIEDLKQWEAVAETDVCRRWWRFMAPIMPSNPDGSPVSTDLQEVFHLDDREAK